MIISFILPQVLLVTGGYDNNYIRLDSTEVLRPGSEWKEITSARLPRPLTAVRVITVNNRVLLFGERRLIITLTAPSDHWPVLQGVRMMMVSPMMTSWSTTRMVDGSS